jgi:hypothetical protein
MKIVKTLIVGLALFAAVVTKSKAKKNKKALKNTKQNKRKLSKIFIKKISHG